MTRPYCVGLTGGVGSGKTTVAQLFSDLGAGIVDTDVISRELTTVGGAALPAIVDRFGGEFMGQDGALNRQAMRNLVFCDSGARQELEALLHPLIREEASKKLGLVGAHYVLLVVPLLAEHLADYRDLVDRIAVVDCEESQQLQRILFRPSLNAAQATAILAAQCSRVARLAIADDVIDNRGNLGALAERVVFLHGQYLLAARGNKH